MTRRLFPTLVTLAALGACKPAAPALDTAAPEPEPEPEVESQREPTWSPLSGERTWTLGGPRVRGGEPTDSADPTEPSTPAEPPFLIQAALSGQYVFALDIEGQVWSAGRPPEDDPEGEGLGECERADLSLPGRVSALSEVVALAAGEQFTLALDGEGRVWAWGNNHSGQLGTDELPSSCRPVVVEGLAGVRAIAAGDSFALALDEDGAVWAWGANGSGQLGNGDTAVQWRPSRLELPVEVHAIAAGAEFALAVDEEGALYAWGSNTQGQLGLMGQSWVSSPQQLDLEGSFVAVYASADAAFAQDDLGQTWAWGDWQGSGADAGQRAVMPDEHIFPSPIDSLQQLGQLAGGAGHVLAVDDWGNLNAWGRNDHGQLGLGTRSELEGLSTPEPKVTVLQVSARGAGSAAVDPEGRLYTWGANDRGQLGLGHSEDRSIPTQVGFAGAE